METLAPVHACSVTRIPLFTAGSTTFIDITDRIDTFVRTAKVRTGMVTIQSLHTTTAVVVNEGEPLLHADFHGLFERLASSGGNYQHDNLAERQGIAADEPLNGHAHCRALLLPTSVTLTIVGGRLTLGRWQRIFFVELDGPRRRELSAVIVGEAA